KRASALQSRTGLPSCRLLRFKRKVIWAISKASGPCRGQCWVTLWVFCRLPHLKDVVNDILSLARYESAARCVTIRTDLSQDLPRLSGDRVQLQQVLLNQDAARRCL